MDYQETECYHMESDTKQSPNNMATASLVMGILSLALFCCCWDGLIFGSLGILFAILSRADGQLESKARAGLITSSIGLALTVLIWGGFIAFLLIADSGIPGPVQNLPAFPEIPDITHVSPDNVVRLLPPRLTGGGLL